MIEHIMTIIDKVLSSKHTKQQKLLNVVKKPFDDSKIKNFSDAISDITTLSQLAPLCHFVLFTQFYFHKLGNFGVTC